MREHDRNRQLVVSEELNQLTERVIGAAIRIHRDLGPGLLESAYETLLCHALTREGLKVCRQQPVQLAYDGVRFDESFRVDVLVNDWLVLEIKSAIRLEPVFTRQLLTYLRLMNLPLGLLMNFGAPTLTHGLHRVFNPRAMN